jgi:hypothetical protein
LPSRGDGLQFRGDHDGARVNLGYRAWNQSSGEPPSIEELSTCGEAPQTSRAPPVVVNGMTPYRTNANELPPTASVSSCLVWTMCAVVGLRPSALGLALCDTPTAMTYKQLTARLQAPSNKTKPAGALALCKSHWRGWDVLAAQEGTFLIGGFRKGVRHLMGFNAGTGVLFVGPETRCVSAHDVATIARLAIELEDEYDVTIGNDGIVRQLWCRPGAAGFRELPFAA